jgi:hypothetical protein
MVVYERFTPGVVLQHGCRRAHVSKNEPRRTVVARGTADYMNEFDFSVNGDLPCASGRA